MTRAKRSGHPHFAFLEILVVKSDMEELIPVTERSNILTQDIDKANAREIVSLLEKCDEQIFNGWEDNEGIFAERITTTLESVARKAAAFVSPRAHLAKVILSGCGTSGRIAFLISRGFNELASKQNLRACYGYICAGGDHALTRSVETFEDDWNAGKEALVKEAEGLKKVLFIGITCGLSAPFVGGQVEYCLQHPDRFTPYLLGFNPVNQARDTPIKGTKKVLLDIAREMKEKCHLLNPIVGPEAITGSSRMKGGSATKIILESILIVAHQLAIDQSTTIACHQVIDAYKMIFDLTYRQQQDIVPLVELSGASLSQGGSVIYLGWNSLGIMSMIDAAECVPTFGARYEDVQGFINDGYKTMKNKEGDLSSQEDAFEISLDYFRKERCHTLSEKDTVIFIIDSVSIDDMVSLEMREMAMLVKAQRSTVALIGITTDSNKCQQFLEVQKILGNPASVHISISKLRQHCLGSLALEKLLEQCLAEISLKWVINAISTGAHILKGKVLKNYMIDLRLTNRKLFERAVSIVSLFGKTDSTQARNCLLKSIYRIDVLSSVVLQADTSQHIQQAGLVDRVIPLALLMSKGRFTVASGLKALEACPIIRQCIDKHV